MDDQFEDLPQSLTDSDTPVNLRPDLSLVGIVEYDRGICHDTVENRRILRANKLSWYTMYDAEGKPNGLIEAISVEMSQNRSISNIEDRRQLLSDSRYANSDYITGEDLLYDLDIDRLVPHWVISATRTWVRVEERREAEGKTVWPHLGGPPARCTAIKADGMRCTLWTSGRADDAGFCKTHLLAAKRDSAPIVEHARERIKATAVVATDRLLDLMDNATSEPVRLKAATEILDRAGVRGGTEIDTNVHIEVHSAADVLKERMDKLIKGKQHAQELLSSPTDNTEDGNIIEAEVVEDDQ